MASVYIADLELHGVLIFASEQRPSLSEEGGPIISTSFFIHNYPLIYGFNGRDAEAYAVIPSLHFLSYDELKKSKFVSRLARSPLKYGFVEEQLKNLLEGREAVYAYPAYPVRVFTKKLFMQAKGSGYAEFRGALKTVYPRLEHYLAVIPPSRFRTIMVSTKRELPEIMYVRIGMKRMGLFKAYMKPADDVVCSKGSVDWSTVPVNLYDTELFGYTILDSIRVLETRSKPPEKPLASIIGYVKTRNICTVKCGREEYKVPLPQKLLSIVKK